MTTLFEFRRNARETVRVDLSEFRGKVFVNIRHWYDDGDGMKPGNKGVTVPAQHIGNVADALAKAAKLLGAEAGR